MDNSELYRSVRIIEKVQTLGGLCLFGVMEAFAVQQDSYPSAAVGIAALAASRLSVHMARSIQDRTIHQEFDE